MPLQKAANCLAVDMEDNPYKAMPIQLVHKQYKFLPFLVTVHTLWIGQIKEVVLTIWVARVERQDYLRLPHSLSLLQATYTKVKVCINVEKLYNQDHDVEQSKWLRLGICAEIIFFFFGFCWFCMYIHLPIRNVILDSIYLTLLQVHACQITKQNYLKVTASRNYLNGLPSKPCPDNVFFSSFPRTWILEDIAVSTVKFWVIRIWKNSLFFSIHTPNLFDHAKIQ